MPIIRTTSSTSRLIWPWVTRQAPNASTAALPTAMPVSVRPRVSELVASTHIVLRKTSCARSASSRPRSVLCPNAFSVARPCTESRNSAAKPRYAFDRRMLLFASQRWNTAGANRVNIANANIRAADGKVEEREQHQDDDGGDEGDQELRQVLAEVGLELLDPVDHRDHDRAGALQPEVGGAERRHPGVEPLAQLELHHRRGAVGDHGAGVLQPAAEHHHRRHQRERHHQLGERVPGEDPREQPPEQREPPDPDQRREHPHRHRGRDAQAHAVRELPEAGVEEHGGCSSEGEAAVTQVSGFVALASRFETDAHSLGNDVLVVKAVAHPHQDSVPSSDFEAIRPPGLRTPSSLACVRLFAESAARRRA